MGTLVDYETEHTKRKLKKAKELYGPSRIESKNHAVRMAKREILTLCVMLESTQREIKSLKGMKYSQSYNRAVGGAESIKDTIASIWYLIEEEKETNDRKFEIKVDENGED